MRPWRSPRITAPVNAPHLPASGAAHRRQRLAGRGTAVAVAVTALGSAAARRTPRAARRSPGTEPRGEARSSDVTLEVVEVFGCGLGTLSLKDLEPGELVLAERPVLRFDASDAALRRAERRLAQLPRAQRDAVLELEDSVSFGPKTFRGILETNGMDCEGPVSSESDPKALFLRLSRLNHSCNANCDYSWRQDIMEIYAQRKIIAGEELCIPYIDLREPRQVRRQMLKENWCFRCECEVCSAWTVASDARRVRLGELSAMMYRARAPERLVRIARKLLRLYKEECINAQSYRKEACKFGYEASLRLEDVDLAPRFARHGPAHEETQEWLEISSLWS
ncbi:unnamed protein product [Durusdinium trenchii]|uniref:SET domain-containing protein n=1 Tax=Durusdinium trenchii TaxID=1381693 RepID=A0ABP0P166_9DINO